MGSVTPKKDYSRGKNNRVVLNKRVGGNFFQFLQVKIHVFGKISNLIKVSFIVQCTKKMQLITSQNFNIQTCFSKFLWFFS